MAKKGVFFERDNLAGHQLITRSGVGTVDIDGGALVVVGDVDTANKELYEVTLATATSDADIAIARNPVERLVDQNGTYFIGESADDRNYTNIKGRPLNFIIPKVNYVFGIQQANITGTTEPTVGKFLEPDASGKYQIKATQTADTPCFVVEDIIEQEYPTGNYNDGIEKVYIIRCVYI